MPTETYDHQCHVCAMHRALPLDPGAGDVQSYCHQCEEQTRWLKVGSVPHARRVKERESFSGKTAGELITWLRRLPAGTALLGNNVVGEMCGTPSFAYQVYDEGDADEDGKVPDPCVMVWLD